MDRTYRALAGAAAAQEVEAEISPVAEVAKTVGASKVVELEAFLAAASVENSHASQPSARAEIACAAVKSN
jgi:hypothetical protein